MDKTTFYLIVCISVPAYILSIGYCYLRLRDYIKNYNKISDMNDITILRTEIKNQMIGAIFVGLFGFIIAAAIFFVESLSNLEAIFCYAFFISIFIFIISAKKYEKQIVNMPTDNEQLDEIKKHIVSVWHTKLLPKFRK